MPQLVLDCSVAVGWCFADEASSELDALLDRVQRDGAVVPPLWVQEVGNVLLNAMRRGRLAAEAVPERLALLDMLPISVDTGGIGPVWRSNVLTLAQTEGLTFYDAVYLELAIRRGLRLATNEQALRRAAYRRGAAPALA